MALAQSASPVGIETREAFGFDVVGWNPVNLFSPGAAQAVEDGRRLALYPHDPLYAVFVNSGEGKIVLAGEGRREAKVTSDGKSMVVLSRDGRNEVEVKKAA